MNELEEKFYTIAAEEIATKRLVPAIFAKALADADGDEKKAIARYIKLRVQGLAEDFARQLAEEQTRLQARQRAGEFDWTGAAFCLGCRRVVPAVELLYWSRYGIYCHEACLGLLTFTLQRREAQEPPQRDK